LVGIGYGLSSGSTAADIGVMAAADYGAWRVAPKSPGACAGSACRCWRELFDRRADLGHDGADSRPAPTWRAWSSRCDPDGELAGERLTEPETDGRPSQSR